MYHRVRAGWWGAGWSSCAFLRKARAPAVMYAERAASEASKSAACQAPLRRWPVAPEPRLRIPERWGSVPQCTPPRSAIHSSKRRWASRGRFAWG